MAMIFEPQQTTLLKTTDDRTFPVSRVFCVGRNYAAHAREMGADPDREPPFYFTKWPEVVINSDPLDKAEIVYPPETENYHHEVELVVAIGVGGFRIALAEALKHVCGYAVGLDMTRRDLQQEAKDKRRPWDSAKNVEESCPTGRLMMVAPDAPAPSGNISLSVNGTVRQEANLNELIWSVPEVIAHLSRYYTLRPGDLIYTGTPAGVAAVVPGDELVGEISGLPGFRVRIGAAV